MEGVVRTTVGYAGGTSPAPTYRRIGDHTETLEIEFDPTVLSFEDLLEEFWLSHDPTRPAYSTQYRSAVFYHDPEQMRAATESRARAGEVRRRRIETSIEAVKPFTRAEDYHQKYRLRSDRTLMAEFRAMLGDGAAFADSTAAARVNGFLDGFGTPAALDLLDGRLGLTEAGLRHLGMRISDGDGIRSPRCG